MEGYHYGRLSLWEVIITGGWHYGRLASWEVSTGVLYSGMYHGWGGVFSKKYAILYLRTI